jgi:hypothetical protein
MLQIVGMDLAIRHAVKPSSTVYLALHRIVRFCPMQTSLLGTSTPVIIGVLSDMPCARFPNRGCRLRFDTCSGEEIRPLREPYFLQRERDPLILQNNPGVSGYLAPFSRHRCHFSSFYSSAAIIYLCRCCRAPSIKGGVNR